MQAEDQVAIVEQAFNSICIFDWWSQGHYNFISGNIVAFIMTFPYVAKRFMSCMVM